MTGDAAVQHQEGAFCECAHCKDKRSFILPKHLLDAFNSRNVVIFAGAGISTENKTYAQHTLYESISNKLGVSDISFPKLMTQFCNLPDGRANLIQEIMSRFNYQRSFDDIYNGVTRFHKALRSLYMIDTVVTTNWDTFFEDEAGFQPFVYDADLPFWPSAKRKVLKIHGSITNSGSIVATEEDYVKSYKRLSQGSLGAQLKSIVSTSTIIYVGYSLRDENYLKLIKILAKLMGSHTKHSYFVSPYADKADFSKIPLKMTPIATDGTYFLERIRSELEDKFSITKESAFVRVDDLLDSAVDLHMKTADEFVKRPTAALMLALSYQDGLIHACQRILRMKKEGEYYCLENVHELVHVYLFKENNFVSQDDLWNAAYCSGYKNGLLFLMFANEEKEPPFPPAVEIEHDAFENVGSLSRLKRFPSKRIPKKFQQFFSDFVAKNNPDHEIMIPDHTPFV